MDAENDEVLSRRHFLRSAAAIGAAAWLVPHDLLGAPGLGEGPPQVKEGPVQQIRRGAATNTIRVRRVRGNVSLLTGSGGNVTVAAGRDGVLLADSGIIGRKVASAVARITRAPITHVVNTHWHFDHTDGNAWLHDRGATIIAHENTRRRMSAVTRVEDWDFDVPRSAVGALPESVVTSPRTIEFDRSEVALAGYAPSHTDSDLSVHFTGPDVLCVGDTWWNGQYPFIDYSTGGSIGGTIRAADVTLARAGAGTLIVPGHGPVGRPGDLARFRDTLATIGDRVATLKAQGRTVAEVVAAKPTRGFDAAYAHGVIGPEFFTRLVYKGV
jgi:glyoxylase-like metal-dependent hydrolase (beta-lactamase superfamily II)